MALLSCSFLRYLYFQRPIRPSCSLEMIARSSSTVAAKTSGESKLLPFSKIPGPKGSIRNVLGYMLNKRSRLDMAKERFDRFGPIYSEQVLGMRVVNISDAAAVAKVLRTEKNFQMRPGLENFNEIMVRNNGLALLSNDYEQWYPERSLLSPKMLRPKGISEKYPQLNNVANDFIEELKLRTQFTGILENIEDELNFWSVEALALYLFDQRLGFYNHPPDPAAVAFIDAALDVADSVGELAVNAPFLQYFKTPAYYRAEKSMAAMYSSVRSIVEKVLATRQKQGNDGSHKESLFDYFVANGRDASTSTGAIGGLLVGAVDTTSITALWFLYELSRQHDFQEKLFQELTTAVGPDGEVSASNLPPLLKAALKESQRMYPVAGYAVLRVFDKDLDILGYHIPSGVNILMHEHMMLLDERYFGRNAKKFVPERWLRDEAKNKQELNAFLSLPFGYGVRMCIGRRIAESMIYTLVSKILLNYRLEYAGEKDINPCVMPTLMKPDQPVKIKFVPRQL